MGNNEEDNSQKELIKKRRDNPELIPIASKEDTEYFENRLYKLCNVYMDQIETLSEKRYGALIRRAMTFDVQRGLVLGQVPNLRFIHSEWFVKWEGDLWDRINARIDSVSDHFFDGI